jgi:hypothetical protein
MQIRRILAPCLALLIATAPTVLAQRNNDNNQKPPQRSAAEQQDIEALVRAVDAVATGSPAPADIPVTWVSNHFVKGQGGDTYIPFTLTIDRSKLAAPGARLYIRIVDKKQPAAPAAAAPPAQAQGNDRDREREKEKQAAAAPVPPMYAWDRIYSIDVPQDGKLSRAIQLKPGEYDVFVAVKDRTAEAPAQGNQRDRDRRNNDNRNNDNAQQAATAAAKVGILRRDLTVPDFNAADLTTSSVILATNVEPTQGQLSPADQEANPYVFGPMRIVPSPDARYSKGGELHVIFWIYGAAAGANGKPDVTIDYNFHQRLAEGEKYFNKTQPQVLNAESLPPEFNVAAGHQLPGSLVVPMSAFPAGDYRLEIKVTDRAGNKTATQNVNFTVLPV